LPSCHPLSVSSSVYHSPPPAIYSLSLHDALPIFAHGDQAAFLEGLGAELPEKFVEPGPVAGDAPVGLLGDLVDDVQPEALHALRSEEHTSELQSRFDLVCRLLLEKKK